MQDSLLIVHASDNWFNTYLNNERTEVIKTRIQSRINNYLNSGKRIFYTPYISNEKIFPSYFLENKLITNIQISENGISMLALNKIKFEVISLLDLFQENNINSVEIGGVQYYACVNGTCKTINTIEKSDLREYMKCNPSKDNYRLICAIKRKISVCINKELTDHR